MTQQTAVEWFAEQAEKLLFDLSKNNNTFQLELCLHGLNELESHAKHLENRQHGIFLNWFIKHYSTVTIDGMFGWANAMGEEVTINEILNHYETYKQNNL